MPLLGNSVLKKIRSGDLALGFGVHLLRGSAVPMLAKAAGYDWLFIDAVDAREVPRYPTPADIEKWQETSPASPKNRRGAALPPKAGNQAKAQLRKRENDGKADLKWPGGRAGSR